MSYTLTMIKPDSFVKGLENLILSRILSEGFSVVEMRVKMLSMDEAEEFYKEHKGKDFYSGLISFMTSGPLIAICLSSPNAVAKFRKLIGNTDPQKAEPGSIRKIWGTDISHNAIHGADSTENAKREILFFFPHLKNKIK